MNNFERGGTVMTIRKMKKLCRGGIFIMLLILMSISLTGCAFLAALGPILSVLGSLASVAGTIVGIFNPQVGSAISQAGGALSQSGDTMSAYAAQFPPQQPTSPQQFTSPTVVGAPTTSEDGSGQKQRTSAPAAAPQATRVSAQGQSQGSSQGPTSGQAAANTSTPFSSISNLPANKTQGSFSNINDVPAQPVVLLEDAFRPILPTSVYQMVDWKAAPQPASKAP